MAGESERTRLVTVSSRNTRYEAVPEEQDERVVQISELSETMRASEELIEKLTGLRGKTIMIMGKAGVGKTSLIKVICKADSAVVGRGTGPATDKTITYTIENEDLKLNIIDTPGLYDDEDEYVKMIKKEAGKADIIFFCMDMSSNLCGDDRTALRLMGRHFSPRFLEKTVFVLTKANRVERFGDNVKNFTQERYFKEVLSEKNDEIATKLKQAGLAIDKNTIQVAIAGSPNPYENNGEERRLDIPTELVNNVRVHVYLDDYNNPEQWLAPFIITCLCSGANECAKLTLIKIHTNWKKLATAGAAGTVSIAAVGGGITLCVIGAGVTPLPGAGIALAPVLCSLGGILLTLGVSGLVGSATAGVVIAKKCKEQ